MSSRKPFYKLTPRGKRKRIKKVVSKEESSDENYEYLSSNQQNPDPQNEQISNTDISLPGYCDNNCNLDCPESAFTSDLDKNYPTISPPPNKIFEILDKCTVNDSSDDSDDYFLKESEGKRFERDIRNWSVQFAITNVALSALLTVLKGHDCFNTLPSDARTLKETPTSVELKPVHPGNYCHIGIAHSLQKIWTMVVECVSSIELFVGIDGIPLFNSSSDELWPILGSVLNVPSLKSQVFPIGIYHGKSKPSCPKSFLCYFVEEVVSLIKNGIVLNGKKITVVLRGICCDAPAKAFILGIKSHNGYSSCTRCKQKGYWVNNRMSFPEVDCEARTHVGFLNKEDEGFHVRDSALSLIPGLDLVSSIPLDYMHLVCLGVMRTMLLMWVFGKPPLKFQSRVISTISSKLMALQKCMPYEFCRKPRSLDDLKRWKATEYRQFLIYTGPLVLKSAFLPDYQDIYNLFISLHVSMTILLSPSLFQCHQAYANDLLRHFVKSFEGIYGLQYITHNFHGLTHIADDAITFGPLDICSAFKFENFLYTLKKLVRKADKPLQQVVNRLNEISSSDIKFHPFSKKNIDYSKLPKRFPHFMNSHSSEPVFDGCDSSKQFKFAQFQFFKLSITTPNNCCRLSDGSIVLISNFIFSNQCKAMVIICRKFENVSDFYGPPFCPSSSLGIYKVSGLSNNDDIREVSLITNKMVFLSPGDGDSIVVPLMHSE